MAQDFVDALYRWVLGATDAIRALVLPILVLLLGGAALLLLFSRVDREDLASHGATWKRIAIPVGKVAASLMLAILFCGLLSQGRQTVALRRETLENAQSSGRNEPVLSSVVQYAPSIAMMQETTYVRRITLPTDIAARIGREGLEVLTPYLTNPGSDEVTKLGDSFVHSGSDIVFTRQLTRLDEVPTAAFSAEVKVRFSRGGASGKQQTYNADFVSEYKFKNPGAKPMEMRCVFPLPQGGGTVDGFDMAVNGVKVANQDRQAQFSWQDTVQPEAVVRVNVHYRLNGGAGYSYVLGSDRRRTGSFHLVILSADGMPRFQKTAIFPTKLSSTEAEWTLDNVLTSQTIALDFPPGNAGEELFDKTLSLLPVCLVTFALGAIWIRPHHAPLGVVGFGIGLLTVSVLSAYVALPWATVLGTLLAFLLGAAALACKRGLLLALLCGLAPLVFLSGRHGTLLLLILALIAFLLMMLARWLSEPVEIDLTHPN